MPFMEDEVAKEPSTSEEPLKSLHVVCAPGGGAFSVYMFLRYTLAQLSDPQISEVKLTMLCREKKGETIDAEEWWNLWSKDENLSEKLGAPKGWSPEFVQKNVKPKSLVQRTADIYILIIAGGDQKRLIQNYKMLVESSETVHLVAEEDMTTYQNGNFLFEPIPGQLLNTTERSVISPQETLKSIEAAKGRLLAKFIGLPRKIRIEKYRVNKATSVREKKEGTCEVRWISEIQFSEHDSTRLFVQVKPIFSNPKGVEIKNKHAIREYLKDWVDDWFLWRKSIRFILPTKYRESLQSFLQRRPDASKLFIQPQSVGRSNTICDKCFIFSKNQYTGEDLTNRELKICSWDTRNTGRSTQLLALMLHGLQPTQDLLLVEYKPKSNAALNFEDTEIFKSLSGSKRRKDMYNEDILDVQITKHETKSILEIVQNYKTLILSTVGLNGPALKNMLVQVKSAQRLTLFDKKDVEKQTLNLDLKSVHRNFMKGVFSIIPISREYGFDELESQWLKGAEKITHITWLTHPNSEPNRTFTPNKLLCTIDESGKVLHVVDWKQNAVVEFLLYAVFYHLAAKESSLLILTTPHIEPSLQRNYLTMDDTNRLKFKKREGGKYPLNAELWFTQKTRGKLQHFVADAKAPWQDPLASTEKAHSELRSKYNWVTANGDIEIHMLSLFGAEEDSVADMNPYLFDKESFEGANYDHFERIAGIYSIDIKCFSRYVEQYLAEPKDRPQSVSFQSFHDKKNRGRNNLNTPIRFNQTKSDAPTSKQSSIHLFRRKHHYHNKRFFSGFFYDCNRDDYENAFYFHNKTISDIGHYAMVLLNIQDQVSLHESKCGQYLIVHKATKNKPSQFGFRTRASFRRPWPWAPKKNRKMHNSLHKNRSRKSQKSMFNRGIQRKSRNRFRKISLKSHQRPRSHNQYRFNQKNSISITALTETGNLELFSTQVRSILADLRKGKTSISLDAYLNRNSSTLSELTEEQLEHLISLLQITTHLGVESRFPDFSDAADVSIHETLSRWASEVLYHLYRKADERLTYDSEDPPRSRISGEIAKIFNLASNSAKSEHPQCTDKFLDFIRGLRFFSDSFSVKASKRYEWYLRQKSRRSSQSSQSDA